jgi:hypothetical protein
MSEVSVSAQTTQKLYNTLKELSVDEINLTITKVDGMYILTVKEFDICCQAKSMDLVLQELTKNFLLKKRLGQV